MITIMIGYEFEFLVREGNIPLTKAAFLEFHKILQADGWKAKLDPDTKGLLGSSKNGTLITCDDSVALMEINQPPTDTLHESHRYMSEMIECLQKIYRRLGCSILGTSVYPGRFDLYNPNCHQTCEHPDVSAKSFVTYIVPQRFGRNHHGTFVIAAHQIWLDLSKNDIARQLRIFNRLSPLFVALFANGPIFNDSALGMYEGRDALWDIYLRNDCQGQKQNIYGMYVNEPDTLFSYIDFIFGLPFFYGIRDGLTFRLLDRTMTNKDFFFSENSDAVYGNGKEFTTEPALIDFLELQHVTYPNARLKFFIKEGVTVSDVKSAYTAKDEQRFLDCFSKFCVEIRPVGAQKKSEVSVAPAFVLGLQENIEEIEALLSAHPYSFWIALYAKVQKGGLVAAYEGISVADCAQAALDIAYEGLQKRGHGEEVFLEPLRERIKRKENPAQELLHIWEKEGMQGVYRSRDFSV